MRKIFKLPVRKNPGHALGIFTVTLMLISGMSGMAPGAAAADDVQVCAMPQFHHALNHLQQALKIPFKARYATATDLYAEIANGREDCELVLSYDERLPILIIRSGHAPADSLRPFARAELILWSAKAGLLEASGAAIHGRRLKSLAVSEPALTPVGFATSEVTARSEFPTDYLKERLYRAEHEYQVMAMVSSGNVESGFVSRPLVTDEQGQIPGSFWTVPREYYHDICYYALLTNRGARNRQAVELHRALEQDPAAGRAFTQAGFKTLRDL